MTALIGFCIVKPTMDRIYFFRINVFVKANRRYIKCWRLCFRQTLQTVRGFCGSFLVR